MNINLNLPKFKINKKDIIFAQDPFKWNGTHLGEINIYNIIDFRVDGSIVYWKIRLYGHETICIVRKCKTNNPCVIDELKSIFGLKKLGTHSVSYLGDTYILIRARCTMDGASIVGEHTLKDLYNTVIMTNSYLRRTIREIFVFRDLLCLSKTNESSILLRRTGFATPGIVDMMENEIYPVSFIENNININKLSNVSSPSVLSQQTLDKWFIDETPSEILVKMCSSVSVTKNNILTIVNKFRTNIEMIVDRIQPGTGILVSNVIVNKLSARLQLACDQNLK